jgi:hypothetical protein
MSIHRNDARSDANQPSIKKALEAIGCKVYILRQPLDLLVSGGRLGDFNLLMEVKMPGAALNVTQRLFTDAWPGRWVVVTTAEEALEAVLGKDLLR